MVAVALCGALAAALVVAASTEGRRPGEPGSSVRIAAESATSTPVVEPTPRPAWDPARPDCPTGWIAYNDPDGYFSVCHPPGLLRGAGNFRPSSSEGIAFTIADPENQGVAPRNVLSLRLYFHPVAGQTGQGSPGPGMCTNYGAALTRPTWIGYIETKIDGRTAFGCGAEGPSGFVGLPVRDVELKVAATRDGVHPEGYVIVAFAYLGPDLGGTLERIEEILQTVRLR